MTERFEPAFLAMSIVLGESREQALDSLGPGGALHAAELARALAAPTREARARALAGALAEVAAAVAAEGLS
jgi:hypothetical protein